MILLILLVLSNLALGKDYFTAAVFEHRPRVSEKSGLPPKAIISSNLRFYVKAVELAAQQGADIIVFNEYGLFPYPAGRDNFRNFAEDIPDPKQQKFNPCLANAEDRRVILHSLSCLARKNGIYLVANMADIHECDGTCDADEIETCGKDCPEDGLLIYNSNVVFDPEGTIIARYHKLHPYFEHVNIPEEPFITFTTDFGKFGLIVCFDSVFHESVQLSKDIDTLIFPTYWFDDIVPLNAVEWQQSWALANGVNFLAANTQTPGNASFGSGIYSKVDGALVYTYEPDGQSKLLVANVKLRNSVEVPAKSSIFVVTEDGILPKVENGENFPEHGYEKILGPAVDKFNDYRYSKSQTEKYTKVKLEEPSGELQVCHNGFCCSLSYSAKDMREDFYLVAFSGENDVRNYYHWYEENCFLIRCDPLEDEPCVLHTPKSNTVFTSVKLSGRFSHGVVYPTVSKRNFRLASKKEWKYETNNLDTQLIFESASDEPLLKVGLLGRIYERDPPYIPFHKF